MVTRECVSEFDSVQTDMVTVSFAYIAPRMVSEYPIIAGTKMINSKFHKTTTGLKNMNLHGNNLTTKHMYIVLGSANSTSGWMACCRLAAQPSVSGQNCHV